MEDWGYWINEPIFIDKGASYAKRKHILYSFCVNGLIPFVEKAGYRFIYKDKELFKVVLTLLYYIHQGKSLKPNFIECDAYDEQHATFHHKLDTHDWMKFWDTWGHIQDFDTEGYAHQIQFGMAEFVWSWLDFENSKTIKKVYEDFYNEDYHEEGHRGKEDPYLQETSKRDYQDRHW